jgi:hypothetical protein
MHPEPNSRPASSSVSRMPVSPDASPNIAALIRDNEADGKEATR